MRRRTVLAAAVAIGMAVIGLASEPEKKPEGPKPAPEVEPLGYFLGPWSSEGEVKPGPMGPGGPTQGREICRWMPGKFFVGCMIETKTSAGLMQVQGIMGWDAEKKVYRWWSFDNLGQAESATGTLKDGTWTWSGESRIGDKMVKTRYTVSNTRPDGYLYVLESSADGKTWTALMTGKTTKMAQRPGPTPGAGARPPGPPTTPVPDKKP